VIAPDNPQPWYADGLRFACTQCGACCSGAPGYVWVTGDEIDAIAAKLGLSAEQFNKRHVRRVSRGRSLLEKKNGDCEFLLRLTDKRTACAIHDVRPVQCRTWPFWNSNVETPDTWRRTAAGCPGLDHGSIHPLPVIQTALEENGARPL
jgi:Fe-S-cluster containining protein